MKRKSAEEIMSASRPQDIFTMNADMIEQEKDEYIEQFKPQAYSTIKNFLVTQKVIQLYRQALSELGKSDGEGVPITSLTISTPNGKTYEFKCHYDYDIKLGRMYVTENNIVFVIKKKNKKYYDNYVAKTQRFPKLDKEVWKRIEYMLPKVSKYFKDENGDWIIIVDKPCRIYPLREILNYYGGKIEPEYVASIMTRLYNFVCYMEVIGMNHNGITIDNLFFAPGRTVEEGENYTVEDMRIVGIFGGWFFTTWAEEKLQGVPKDIFEILPMNSRKSGFSSFEVDELSIKRVARELLGDGTGENFENVPDPFVRWVNSSEIHKNAYDEFCAWERARKLSFGKHRFVEMDVSIDKII